MACVDKLVARMIELKSRGAHIDCDEIIDKVLEDIEIKERVKTSGGFAFYKHEGYRRMYGYINTNGMREAEGHYEWTNELGEDGVCVPDQCVRYEHQERRQDGPDA